MLKALFVCLDTVLLIAVIYGIRRVQQEVSFLRSDLKFRSSDIKLTLDEWGSECSSTGKRILEQVSFQDFEYHPPIETKNKKTPKKKAKQKTKKDDVAGC